jgi:hypothetical protein
MGKRTEYQHYERAAKIDEAEIAAHAGKSYCSFGVKHIKNEPEFNLNHFESISGGHVFDKFWLLSRSWKLRMRLTKRRSKVNGLESIQ